MCRFPPTKRQGLEHHMAPHLAQRGKSLPVFPQVEHWITCVHSLDCRSRLARMGCRSDATCGDVCIDDDDDVGEGGQSREDRVIYGDSSESEPFPHGKEASGLSSKANVTLLRFFLGDRIMIDEG
jgi:hypothetical protein